MTANQMKKFGVGIMGASLALMLSMSSASAATYNFFRITDNGNGVNVGSQLSVDVLSVSNTQVSFTFYNNVGTASSITDIYFDDATTPLLASPIAGISDSGAGVAFSAPATPGDLPGGNGASPAFEATGILSADSAAPVSANGVNASTEWVKLILNYATAGAGAFDTIIAALNSGALRLGLHVQAIGQVGGSDSYINNRFTRPNEAVVPLPAALPLLLGALGGLGWLARRQKRRGSAA
jgi:hypothetical protein